MKKKPQEQFVLLISFGLTDGFSFYGVFSTEKAAREAAFVKVSEGDTFDIRRANLGEGGYGEWVARGGCDWNYDYDSDSQESKRWYSHDHTVHCADHAEEVW